MQRQIRVQRGGTQKFIRATIDGKQWAIYLGSLKCYPPSKQPAYTYGSMEFSIKFEDGSYWLRGGGVYGRLQFPQEKTMPDTMIVGDDGKVCTPGGLTPGEYELRLVQPSVASLVGRRFSSNNRYGAPTIFEVVGDDPEASYDKTYVKVRVVATPDKTRLGTERSELLASVFSWLKSYEVHFV